MTGKYQIIVHSFANPLREPIWCDTFEQIDEELGKLPFGTCREVLDAAGNTVDEYLPF